MNYETFTIRFKEGNYGSVEVVAESKEKALANVENEIAAGGATYNKTIYVYEENDVNSIKHD